MTSQLRNLDVAERRIAYRLRSGVAPTIVFLPGYASDMEGKKALALDLFAERRGIGMIRFDYSGTGSSGGDFEKATLQTWLEESLAVVDRLTSGRLILVGSSMGAWIALHLGLLRPGCVQGLIGIAAAPDFTDWGFTCEQKKELQQAGCLEQAGPEGTQPMLFTRDLWKSGEALALLGGEIEIDCPVRLLHGECDRDVPLEIALRTMRQLRSADVQLNVLKGGGHRLSEPHEIEAILRALAALLEPAC